MSVAAYAYGTGCSGCGAASTARDASTTWPLPLSCAALMTGPAHVFREYDSRGIADRDLSDALAEGIGRGLAKLLAVNGRAPRLAVGRDCRLSSPRLHEALVRGLLACGVHVVDIGVGPTPMLYFAVHHLDTDGG